MSWTTHSRVKIKIHMKIF